MIKKITHITGERICYKLSVSTAGEQANLSDCVISFRGKLNNSTAYSRRIAAFDDFNAQFSPPDLLDETQDNNLAGRFYLTFADGTTRASERFLIVVKQ